MGAGTSVTDILQRLSMWLNAVQLTGWSYNKELSGLNYQYYKDCKPHI